MLLNQISEITSINFEETKIVVEVRAKPSLFKIGQAQWEQDLKSVSAQTKRTLWKEAENSLKEFWGIDAGKSIRALEVGRTSTLVHFSIPKTGMRMEGVALVPLPGWFERLIEEISQYISKPKVPV